MGVHRFLGGLNEDEEDADADNEGDRKRIPPGNFELDLDGATLLGRRHRRSAGVHASAARTSKQSNGSPLKLEALRIDDTPAGGHGNSLS